MGTGQVENEFILGASEKVEQIRYLNRVTEDVQAPCVITGLESAKDETFDLDAVMTSPDIRMLVMYEGEGERAGDLPIDIVQSPIKEASGWAETVEGAKEFVMLLSSGLIHRPCQIWRNEAGKYDRVAIFKSKKKKNRSLC